MFFKHRGPRALEMLQAPHYLNPALVPCTVLYDIAINVAYKTLSK